jgi:hypothetical protein
MVSLVPALKSVSQILARLCSNDEKGVLSGREK